MKHFLMMAVACTVIGLTPAVAQQETTEDEAIVTFAVDGDATTSATTFCIKAEPVSCVIKIEASVENCGIAAFAEITMQATSTYGQFGRQDSDQISHRWTGRQCSVNLTWPITNGILGGNYQASFSYRLTNGQTGSDRRSGFMAGENPTSDAVRMRSGNPTYDVLMFLGNGFRQFNANGRPRIAAGFGVAALADPSSPELWNWHANLDRGLADFETHFAQAEKHPEMMRQLGFATMPDFTPEQLKLHALQSIAGETYFVPARDGSGWTPMRGRSSFADDIVQIEAEVAAGNPPAGW